MLNWAAGSTQEGAKIAALIVQQADGLRPPAHWGEIEAKGCVVVKGADRPVAVFRHEERVHAVDNRCPHMGFPFLNERAAMAMLIARK